MATKINRTVVVNGVQRWIHANTEQEYADKLAKLYTVQSSAITGKHSFEDFAWNWFNTYSKPNIETVTAVTYKRQLTRYLLPSFKDMAVEDMTTDPIQRLFNGIEGALDTKKKVKMVLNMILDAAVEDGFISKNPAKSKRLRITGAASKPTKEYTVEQMRFLIRNIDKVKQPLDRVYLALQSLHPLRLEEVLGLRWEDIDMDSMVIHVRNAVTHPTRNQPEIKSLKTESSYRDIGLSQIAAKYLTKGNDADFVFGCDKPFSYQKVRRMCERIQKDTGFDERITPRRFRTTVLTDIYDQTRDVKATEKTAGHASPAMTLKHYIKGRGTAANTIATIDRVYGSDRPEFANDLQSSKPAIPCSVRLCDA